VEETYLLSQSSVKACSLLAGTLRFS